MRKPGELREGQVVGATRCSAPRLPMLVALESDRQSDKVGVWGATEQKTGLSTGCRQPLDRRDVNIARLGGVPYILSLVQLG